uniref:Uncharacterized protein n=1 Tax=Arundo donax TaxID=35708 RepID=A0A0A9HJH8_ARUDO
MFDSIPGRFIPYIINYTKEPFILNEFYNLVDEYHHIPCFIYVGVLVKLAEYVLQNHLYIRIKGDRDKEMAIKFCFKVVKQCIGKSRLSQTS